METCGDGCGRGITSEHVALQHPRVFVSRHVGKVPETRPQDTQEFSHMDFQSRRETNTIYVDAPLHQTCCFVKGAVSKNLCYPPTTGDSVIILHQVSDLPACTLFSAAARKRKRANHKELMQKKDRIIKKEGRLYNEGAILAFIMRLVCVRVCLMRRENNWGLFRVKKI